MATMLKPRLHRLWLWIAAIERRLFSWVTLGTCSTCGQACPPDDFECDDCIVDRVA